MIDAAAIAREIKAAQDSAQHIATPTSRHDGFDVDAAYRVAAQLHAARVAEGDVAVGRKIGFTNPAIQREYGVHEPIWGYVYRRTLIDLSSHSTFGIGHLPVPPRLEPEIVLHFHAAPPVGGGPDAILSCIDWIAHGLEIVQSNYADWKFKAPDTVADNGLHAALLLGVKQPVDRLGPGVVDKLEKLTLLLSCDGQLRDSGTGANVLGSPLKAIGHLTRVLAGQGDALKAGELVTTGTITAALPIKAGETWSTEITGIALPGLTARFT